jgi:hypothetical protein
VRRIIDGIAYDTDTATEVVGGDNSAWSAAWWGLYRTQNGTFFKIVVDHDGTTFQEFKTLTDAEVRAELEKHANHLVEKYFGPMPEPGPMRFSRRTVVAAVEVLEGAIQTHAALTRFLLRWGPALAARCDEGSLADRFNHLIKYFDEQPDRRLENGDLLGEELVGSAVSLLPPLETPVVEIFLRALDRDGFAISDGKLLSSLPDALRLPAAQDQLSRLLKKHNLIVPQGHLDQALDAHARGNWAAANSQIRTFLESLFDEIAGRLDPIAAAAVPSGQARRQLLANIAPPFFDRDLNEWRDNGVGFVNGLMARLHPQGSHPGLSHEDDSTFRLHTVLLTARLMLVRFNNRVAT